MKARLTSFEWSNFGQSEWSYEIAATHWSPQELPTSVEYISFLHKLKVFRFFWLFGVHNTVNQLRRWKSTKKVLYVWLKMLRLLNNMHPLLEAWAEAGAFFLKGGHRILIGTWDTLVSTWDPELLWSSCASFSVPSMQMPLWDCDAESYSYYLERLFFEKIEIASCFIC